MKTEKVSKKSRMEFSCRDVMRNFRKLECDQNNY